MSELIAALNQLEKEKGIDIGNLILVSECVDHNAKINEDINNNQTGIKNVCRSVLCNEEGDAMTPGNGDIAVINGAVAAGIGKPQNHKSGNGHGSDHKGRNPDPAELGNRKEHK